MRLSFLVGEEKCHVRKRLPEVKPADFEDAMEYTVSFYKALGWDPTTHELDAPKVRIHEDTWKRIAEEMKQKWGLSGALCWMNYGPSGNASTKIAIDQVDIQNAFIERRQQHEYYGELHIIFTQQQRYCCPKASEHPKIVQQLLGHSSVTLTLDTYSHVTPDMLSKTADTMDALLAKERAIPYAAG